MSRIIYGREVTDKEWANLKQHYIGNLCETDEYRETMPENLLSMVGNAYVDGRIQEHPLRESLETAFKNWVAVYFDYANSYPNPEYDSYRGSDEAAIVSDILLEIDATFNSVHFCGPEDLEMWLKEEL